MKLSIILVILLISFQISAESRYPIPFDLSELDCLALNMYYESRSEQSITDIAAVGYVTLQRVQSEHWPNTICKVVYQQRLSKYQKWTPMFSWTYDGISDIPLNYKSYNKCLKIAQLVMDGDIKDKTKNATHYHNLKVNPYWSSSLIMTTKLGNHIFYK